MYKTLLSLLVILILTIPLQSKAEDLNHLLLGQEVKTMTVSEVARVYNLNANKFSANLNNFVGVQIKPDQDFLFLHQNYGLASNNVISITPAMTSNESFNINLITNTSHQEPSYDFINVIIIISILYFITFLLAKKKIIKKISHRYFWNIILLIAFLGMAILSILLVMRINKGIVFALPFNILYWHVELGLVMVVISLYHIFNHMTYFLMPFKRKKQTITTK